MLINPCGIVNQNDTTLVKKILGNEMTNILGSYIACVIAIHNNIKFYMSEIVIDCKCVYRRQNTFVTVKELCNALS